MHPQLQFLNPFSLEEEMQRDLLQKHFSAFYQLLVDNQLIPGAKQIERQGFQSYLTGIPVAYHNAIFGTPEADLDWDEAIVEQSLPFQQLQMPFVWYIDEVADPSFKERLLQHGFQDLGFFQGIFLNLNGLVAAVELPIGCHIAPIQQEEDLEEFNHLVCSNFRMEGKARELFQQVLRGESQGANPKLFHWALYKDGKMVSTLTTFIQDEIISFWNGVTKPEFRRLGLCTALSAYILQDAAAKGLRYGATYLMADALAHNICQAFGGQTKWRFSVLLGTEKC